MTGPSWFRVWWRAVRPFSFTASVTPVVAGSAAAFYDGAFHPLLFFITLVAAVSIHAATNLANDYYDHVRGVDADQPVGPGGAIQQGHLSPRAVLMGALVLFALSGVLGIWLIAVRGWLIAVIGALSVLAGYAYTGGPLPLGYVGLGDAVVFVFMGLVAVTGTYFVQTGSISATAVWTALPLAALVDAILVVNNLRDFDNDRAKGKRTFATFIGVGATRAYYLTLLVISYASVAAAVGLRVLPPSALLTVITVPRAMRIWRVVRTETDPWLLTRRGLRETALLHFQMGALLALAFVVSRSL